MQKRRFVLDETNSATVNHASSAVEQVQWTWKREPPEKLKTVLYLDSRRSILNLIAEELKLTGHGVYDDFKNSCFGFLLRLDTLGPCSKSALHCVFAHEVVKADAGPDELWYCVGGRFIRFSKYEYALVTGLCFGQTTFDPAAQHDPPASGLFMRRYGGQRLRIDVLRFDFVNGVFRESPPDALKVAKLLIVYFLLFGMDARSPYIDQWAWALIEDTDRWESFIWGKYTFQILLRYLQGVPTELSHSETHSYHIFGFVWAFWIWAFEAIPELGNTCGVLTSDDVLPRCLRWRFLKTQVDMDGFCDRQMEINSTLEPNAEEEKQPYWEHIHDDLRSGVCYLYTDNSFKKKKSVNSSSGDVFRLDNSKDTPMTEKRKRTDPVTPRASVRVADPEKVPNSFDHGGCQKDMTSVVRKEVHLALNEFFSQTNSLDDLLSTPPILAVGSTTSSYHSRFLMTAENSNKGLDFFREFDNPSLDMDSKKPELSNVYVDQMGRNKLIFELNEKINELNKKLENEHLVGVYQEKCKCLEIMIVNMGLEIEKLRQDKLSAIQSVEELKQEKVEADQVVKELEHVNVMAKKTIDELMIRKSESDKIAEVYKSMLEKLSPRIKQIEEDHVNNLTGKGENRSTMDDVVNPSPGVHSTSESTGSRSKGLSNKGENGITHIVNASPGSQSGLNPPQPESNERTKPSGLAAQASCTRLVSEEVCVSKITRSSSGDIEILDSDDESLSDAGIHDFIAGLRSEKLSRKWIYEADLLRALQENDELCMNAVCALYRQQSEMKGCSANGGFSPVDSMSGCALAEYLIGGDKELRLRKSVSQVKRQQPEVIRQCRKLANNYVKKLFAIHCAGDDPFFGQT